MRALQKQAVIALLALSVTFDPASSGQRYGKQSIGFNTDSLTP